MSSWAGMWRNRKREIQSSTFMTISTTRTFAIIYWQLIKLLIATVFAGRVPLVIVKIKLVKQLGLFASATFLVYRGLFSNVVGSNICRL